MTEVTQERKVRRVSVLTEAYIYVDCPHLYLHAREGEPAVETHARELDQWAKELNELLKDHQSMRGVRATVQRQMEGQCAACGYRWEVEDGHCTGCGREVEEGAPDGK